MATLRALPFNLQYGQLIQARISAKNIIGWNVPSDVNIVGATVRIEPVKMGAVTRGSQTTEHQIEILWTPLTLTEELRGAPIVSYNLQWDKGTSGRDWHDLTGITVDSLNTGFIVTSGLLVNYAYQFRVRARNAYGFGDFSDPASIRTSDKPEIMAAVTTLIDSNVNIRIRWDKPYENSESIEVYKILILQSNGVYSELIPLCDGSKTLIITQRYCDIPVATLRASPYSLAQKSLVVAKITSKNAIGWA